MSRPLPGGGRELLEGLVTNLFVFRGGKLLTAGDGVLRGHVREMAIEAARALGVEVVVGGEPLRLEEVHTWDEAFLTGACVCGPLCGLDCWLCLCVCVCGGGGGGGGGRLPSSSSYHKSQTLNQRLCLLCYEIKSNSSNPHTLYPTHTPFTLTHSFTLHPNHPP